MSYTLPSGPYFIPEWFTQKLQEKGSRVEWYKATICSCLSEQTNQPEKTCPYCHGTGFVYSDPIETRVLAMSITGLPEYMLSGLAQFGELLVTPDFDYDFSILDRLVFLDYLTVFTHSVRRGSGDTDTVRYDIIEPDTIFYEGTYYEYGVDYEIDDTNKKKIVWIQNAPPAGRRYGVRYKTHPVYLISKVVHETRATYVKVNGQLTYKEMPQQYIAKREFNFSVTI